MTKLTIHEMSVARIRAKRHPELLHTTGLNLFLDSLDENGEIGFCEGDRFVSRPDAWSYTPDENSELPGTLSIYEIEDSHKLSVAKLREYADLWFNFDDLDLELKLFVYDRYGEQERELDLCEYWFMFIRNDINQPLSLLDR